MELSSQSRYALLTAANDKLGNYRAFKDICRDYGRWSRSDSTIWKQTIHSNTKGAKPLLRDDVGCFIDQMIVGIKRRKDPALKLPFLAFQLHYLTEAQNFDLSYKRLCEFKQELAKNHLPYTVREIKAQENLFIEELRHSIITVLYI